MNTCPDRIVDYMHAYLDGDISLDEERELKSHLEQCGECRSVMSGLSEAVAFMKSASPVQAPEGFADRVMERLPKEKKQAGINRWLRSHPFLTAAAMFLLLMSASLFSGFGNDQQFSVTKQPNLVIEGETVIVPAGEEVKGDLVVKNGNLRIEGKVDGNVTVIHGSKYMASTAVVTGKTEEIDKIFDWLWYTIKEKFQETTDLFNKNNKEN